jgi:hypothetical protein
VKKKKVFSDESSFLGCDVGPEVPDVSKVLMPSFSGSCSPRKTEGDGTTVF